MTGSQDPPTQGTGSYESADAGDRTVGSQEQRISQSAEGAGLVTGTCMQRGFRTLHAVHALPPRHTLVSYEFQGCSRLVWSGSGFYIFGLGNPVRVASYDTAPVPFQSGSQNFSGLGIHLRSRFHIFPVRVCPVRVFQLYFLLILTFFR